jgi:glutathione S-transferase
MAGTRDQRLVTVLLDEIERLKMNGGGVPSEKPKLSYFAGRGLAEPCRTALVQAGVDFEDKRYTLAMVEGTPFPVKEEMQADADKGLFGSNLGRLPVLDVGGKQIGGSKAVLRFICNTYGLAGANNFEAGTIDTISEIIADCQDAFGNAKDKDIWFSSESMAQGSRALFYHISGLNTLVGSNGFAVGNKFSMADCVIFNFFGEVADTAGVFGSPRSEPMGSSKKTDAALAKWAPNLAAIIKNFGSTSNMQKYLAGRGNQLF